MTLSVALAVYLWFQLVSIYNNSIAFLWCQRTEWGQQWILLWSLKAATWKWRITNSNSFTFLAFRLLRYRHLLLQCDKMNWKIAFFSCWALSLIVSFSICRLWKTCLSFTPSRTFQMLVMTVMKRLWWCRILIDYVLWKAIMLFSVEMAYDDSEEKIDIEDDDILWYVEWTPIQSRSTL